MRVLGLGFSYPVQVMRLHSHYLTLSAAFAAAVLAAPSARAQALAAGGSVEATTATPVEATPVAMTGGTSTGGETGLEPRGNLWELGIFGGLLFVSDRNAFAKTTTFANFKQPSPEVGLRLAYLPLSWLGLEIEGMGAAGELRNGTDQSAVVWAGRGHLLLQIPTTYVSPFVLGGGGRMGIISDDAASGKDDDPALHFGAGLKINLHRRVALRLEGRDTITKERPGADTAHHIEALLGLSLVFGRPAPRPADADGDGVIDLQDQCPQEPGLLPDGCPIRDADSDGFPDAKDECPQEAGIAPTGCPVRDADGDGVPDPTDECRDVAGVAPSGCPDGDQDGVLDRDDKCLDVAGVPPDGCPPDSDGDGFIDSKDKCPQEPENKNGFEDDDGCPDEIPAAVQKFTGVIKGIEFETGKANIRSISKPLLEQASAILNQYPSLKVMIVGHTDNVGKREFNIDLSQKRADSVKAFIISQGISTERILTRGEGPDAPLADNKTRSGRQLNRRIEFTIIK
jgi:outer membrane protein OmpA-like peptidoglycan-associated protein